MNHQNILKMNSRSRVVTRCTFFVVILSVATLPACRLLNREERATAATHSESEEDHEGHEHAPSEDHDHEEEPGVVQLTDEQIEATGLVVAEANAGLLQSSINLRGEVRINEDNMAHVSPRIPGVIKSVLKSVGDKVVKGELLAVIDSRQLAEAKAAYIAAKERLKLVELKFEREKALWEKKITPEQEFLDARESFSEARIQHESALYKLQALGLLPQSIKRDLGAGLDKSLGRFPVNAPIGGTIVFKHAGLGEPVTEEREMFVIADLASVWVDLKVYKKDLGTLKKGTKVLVSTDADDTKIEGEIHFISPIFDSETRTAVARLVLPNHNGQLRPGLFVTAHAETVAVTRPVVIPQDAVLTIDNEQVVFLAATDGYSPQPVQLGIRDSSRVEVLSGLKPGQRYVAKGAFELKAKLVTSAMDPHAGHGH